MRMEAACNPLRPQEPLDLVGSSGVILIPVPGLQAALEGFQAGGVRFMAIPPESWRLLEPNRVVDLYLEFYQAIPRFFCVWPFVPQEDNSLPEDFDTVLQAAFVWMDDFLLALRLVAPGMLI